MQSPSPLPPDRGQVPTEQRHPRSMSLDAKDVRNIVDLMIDDHAAIVQAMRGGVAALTAFIEDLIPKMERGGRLVYVGAGTSGRLGVLDAAECPPTFQSQPSQVIGIIAGGDSALRCSSEGAEDEPEGAREALAALVLTAEDTVLGIAAGGTTPYVLGALQIAKTAGATTGLLTCAQPSPVPESCDHLIVLRSGPEVLTGSTRLKAGSATKLALNIITTVAFVRLGKVYSNLMVDLRATNRKLSDRALRILAQVCPGLSRDQAIEALRQARGSLKAAIVMRRRNVDFDKANSLLEEHRGRLRAILDGSPER